MLVIEINLRLASELGVYVFVVNDVYHSLCSVRHDWLNFNHIKSYNQMCFLFLFYLINPTNAMGIL